MNTKELLTTLDELCLGCSGNPVIPRFLGKMFIHDLKPQQQADLDSKNDLVIKYNLKRSAVFVELEKQR